MINKKIENLVSSTQQKWADLILEIGKAYNKKQKLENLVFELLLHNNYTHLTIVMFYLNQPWQNILNSDQLKKNLLPM